MRNAWRKERDVKLIMLLMGGCLIGMMRSGEFSITESQSRAFFINSYYAAIKLKICMLFDRTTFCGKCLRCAPYFTLPTIYHSKAVQFSVSGLPWSLLRRCRVVLRIRIRIRLPGLPFVETQNSLQPHWPRTTLWHLPMVVLYASSKRSCFQIGRASCRERVCLAV